MTFPSKKVYQTLRLRYGRSHSGQMLPERYPTTATTAAVTKNNGLEADVGHGRTV